MGGVQKILCGVEIAAGKAGLGLNWKKTEILNKK